jgi:hypothetical protein
MMAATRSMEECIASDKILTEPLISPVANFIIINKVFDIIESRAILTLAFMRIQGNQEEGKISYKIFTGQNKMFINIAMYLVNP